MIQKKLLKLLVLTDILIQEIEDDTLEMNDTTKEIHNKLNELNKLFLPILDKFYENKQLQKSTISQDIQKKFYYNIDREFKRYKFFQ